MGFCVRVYSGALLYLGLLVLGDARRLERRGWDQGRGSVGECHEAMEAVRNRVNTAIRGLAVNDMDINERLVSAPFKVRIQNVEILGTPALEADSCRYSARRDDLEMNFMFRDIQVKGAVEIFEDSSRMPQFLTSFSSSNEVKDHSRASLPKYLGFVTATFQNSPATIAMTRDYRHSPPIYGFRDAYVFLGNAVPPSDSKILGPDAKEHRTFHDGMTTEVDNEIEDILTRISRNKLQDQIRKMLWNVAKDSLVITFEKPREAITYIRRGYTTSRG